MLILVVDDDDVTCALIEWAMQLDGHEVVTAGKGALTNVVWESRID